jgi:hypothetical protein
MNEEPPILLYKTFTIHLLSFRSEGRWVPHALVVGSTEGEEEGHPVTGDWDHPLSTKKAADAVAQELAMELIDSQCEHDYQLESVGGVYLTGAYVCRLCSHRVGMSDAQFHQHDDYPRHYQQSGTTVDQECARTKNESSRRRS